MRPGTARVTRLRGEEREREKKFVSRLRPSNVLKEEKQDVKVAKMYRNLQNFRCQ